MIMLHVSIIILLSILPRAKSADCDEQNFDWTGDAVQAIDDCDLLRAEMKIHLYRLTNKPNCLEQMVVRMHKTSSFSHEYLGTPGSTQFVQVTNQLTPEERCKATSVHISTMVWGTREYTTTFFLHPEKCVTAKDVNFQKDCSGEDNTDPTTPVTPNQTGTTQPTGTR